jgi:endonuclease/exonuclease/phosphatase family metal-dependent hydrolase
MSEQYFSVLTWNLWKWKGVKVHDWPGDRQLGMSKTIESLSPDIICTQELSPEYLDTILETCPDYKCIIPTDMVLKTNLSATEPVREKEFHAKNLRYRRGNNKNDESYEGWLEESSIIWRADKFVYLDHGSVDVGIGETEERKPKRQLFWVRLSLKDCMNKTILISTAHLTWEGGSGREQEPPFTNERSAQAMRIGTALMSLRKNVSEPMILTGDMNDSWHVPFIMRDKFGLQSHDFLLNLPTQVTHPARPCFHEERIPSQTRDWIFSNPGTGGTLRPVLGRACSDMTLGINRHVSDHAPVLAVFKI